ncbi:MAG: pyridoxal phosphate-dependent aminotransferase [Gammaproteobacteria bacterium]
MDIRLSARVQRIKPSPTLAVSARAAALKEAGQDVIGLGAGEPDFDTPEHIKRAANAAMAAGQTKYTAVDGTAALKQAIIGKFRRDNGLDYTPPQVIVSCGGKQSFFNLCQALLDAGDEVIIPAPYWVSYPDIVLLNDGEPVIIDADIDQGFRITPEQLDAAITPRTRLLVLNSPSNPTGVAYRRAELEALGEVLRRHPHVLIATDDMYELISWGDEPFCNIVMACPDLYPRTIVLNGVSKAYAMTGWRIGYAAGPQPLIRAMAKAQSQSTSNPASISQAAAVAALDGDQSCVEEMRVAFHLRHAFVFERVQKLPGVRCLPADGTFYLLPDFREYIAAHKGIDDDVALSEKLLEGGVALVPGSAFGAPGHLRLSFATSNEVLEAALSRIEHTLESG